MKTAGQTSAQMKSTGYSITENINKASGEGTATFAHLAIEVYCNTKEEPP